MASPASDRRARGRAVRVGSTLAVACRRPRPSACAVRRRRDRANARSRPQRKSASTSAPRQSDLARGCLFGLLALGRRDWASRRFNWLLLGTTSDPVHSLFARLLGNELESELLDEDA